jgi:hypothetical protein
MSHSGGIFFGHLLAAKLRTITISILPAACWRTNLVQLNTAAEATPGPQQLNPPCDIEVGIQREGAETNRLVKQGGDEVKPTTSCADHTPTLPDQAQKAWAQLKQITNGWMKRVRR